ncbi:MAG: hypothetical protein ACAI25_07500 [Planctomycetota bacterium]
MRGLLPLGSLIALASLIALSACVVSGTRSTWEPESEAAARYGSGTDERLLLSSTVIAVRKIVTSHPPGNIKAVAIRIPRDPDGYCAAALLADAFEKGGTAVSWMAFDAAAAPKSTSEVWEVAMTIRGTVTRSIEVAADPTDPPYRRDALVEVRVSSVAASDGRLLWNAKGRGEASCHVNVRFPQRKVIPDAR